MINRNKMKKRYSLLELLLIVFMITVGFALLSTTLKINGTAGLKSNSWNIYWDEESISVDADSIDANEPTVTNSITVSYTVELELPGDFYEFTIDAVNAGTVDAMVDEIETSITDANGDDTTLEDYIKYSVTYANGIKVAKNHLLAKRVDASTPTREKYKIRIEYDKNATTLPSTNLTYNIDTTINYVQADNNAKEKSPILLAEGKTKDTLTAGDDICIIGETTECFDFIKYDGNNVVMLGQYNLNVGSNPKGTATNLQDSDVRGYLQSGTTYGNVPFSGNNYWYDGSNLKEEYGTGYPVDVYDTDYVGDPGTTTYSVAYYVEAYKRILESSKYGATIDKARILTNAEAVALGCGSTCPTTGNNSFITNTSFWLSSAAGNDYLSKVYAHGEFDIDSWCNYSKSERFGVRPVIEISKANI